MLEQMQPHHSQFIADDLAVEVYPSETSMGQAAASRAAEILSVAVAERDAASVIIATGNSQLAFIQALREYDLPWGKVDVFHMDEYVGIPPDHPASFRHWIRNNVEDVFSPAGVHYIDGEGNLDEECDRYEKLLRAVGPDLSCLGIGENGHLAFNEPDAADFTDHRWARVVTLTEQTRSQQVGEGHFPDLVSVPTQAITLTVPALLAARNVQVCVPELRKAAAVARALSDPIGQRCPATILRSASHARLYLDSESASASPIDVGDAGQTHR